MVDTSELTKAGRTELLCIIREQQEEIRRLCAPELARKDQQIAELQARMTEMVSNSLARRVRAFHLKFGHPVNTTPKVPDEAQVQFRLRLITEEFFELLEASGLKGAGVESTVSTVDPESEEVFDPHEMILNHIEHGEIDVSLAEFSDALADLDYVIEGTRAVFGIDGTPIMDEVQRANLAKEPADVAAADAAKRGERIKPTKPPGWSPPGVAGALMRQGWRP